MRKHRQLARAAVDIAREACSGVGALDSPKSAFFEVVRRFSVEFEVPGDPDADGYLFQYGKVNWLSEPTFSFGLVRQLEVVDPCGEHECYLQVQFELRYSLDEELENVGSHTEWWFPGGDCLLDSWLSSLAELPMVDFLSRKALREFVVWQDEAC
ncbi:hypothetical protein [Streptomyces sp. NPDC002994]|uniref:hypothetical protein n=1 Tax=Streptomyces sp. NPDC002994 TaxID=3154441 RepID=UPI0033BA37BE